MDYRNCIHCGADEGLHHYNTMQCPKNGMESPIGVAQVWMNTVYTPEPGTESMENRISLLEKRIAQLEARLEA